MNRQLLTLTIFAIIDLNCFVNSQAQGWQWAKSAIGAQSEYGTSIALDSNGNSYVTGYFNSPTIIFGSDTLTNVAINDIFLVKYDPLGNVIWAKSAGGMDGEIPNSIAVDANGNTYITGMYDSFSISFDSITLTNSNQGINHLDVFVVKYDSSGNVIWAKSAGGPSDDIGYGIMVDVNGNAYITGTFYSAFFTIGGITFNNVNTGIPDFFIAKYDLAGNLLWAHAAGGINYDVGYGIAVDLSGNVYAAGTFSSPSITFGGITLTNKGLFLVKYDSLGNVIWAKDALGNALCTIVSIDVLGNPYIAGEYNPVLNFGNTTITSTGSVDIFIAKFDSSGNPLWAKSAGGTDLDEPLGMAVDAIGNSYITGTFNSPLISFGNITLNKPFNNNIPDIYVAKYDNQGNVIGAITAGDSLYEKSQSIAVNIAGNSYITGNFSGPTFNLGSTTLTNSGPGNIDFFVAKLDNLTGLFEHNGSNNYVNIYPNPANDLLVISYPNLPNKEVSVSISDITGKVIFTTTSTNTQKLEVNTKDFVGGVYFVQVRTKDFVETRKVVVEK